MGKSAKQSAKKTVHGNSCSVFDVRISATKELTETVIIKSLLKIAKKFVFQLEKGEENGYMHYQGRISLIKRSTKGPLLTLFKALPMGAPQYLEPTTNKEFTKQAFYCLKEQTKVKGPWTEKDADKANVFIPDCISEHVNNLWPFQQAILDMKVNRRKIMIVYSPSGNQGRSTIAGIAEDYYGGMVIPPIHNAKDMIQFVCSSLMTDEQRNPGPFFIDLPRACAQSKEMYSAIETIKSGRVYDIRNKARKWKFNAPNIWVFTNHLPMKCMLSPDRWDIYIVNKHKLLEEYNPYVVDSDDSDTL